MDREEFDKLVMRRCFELARRGAGRVRTNPLVGAVVVHRGKIIGEGYHEYFGGPHAEVNALASVSPDLRPSLPESTLYVSLEPCCTFGKTPPCTDLVLEKGIREVVVSAIDPAPEMRGQGLSLLAGKSVQVREGVLGKEGRDLIRAFATGKEKKRPYVILKYAQSRSGHFAPAPARRQWITDPVARRLVHKWRAESDAILVGFQTAVIDDPALTNRFYPGPSPVRIVLDPHGKLPDNLQLFRDGKPTWQVVHPEAAPASPGPAAEVSRLRVPDLAALLGELYRRDIGTLLVEGGARTLRQFIDQDLWDEARVFTGPFPLRSGLRAPVWSLPPVRTVRLGKNMLDIFANPRFRER